MVSFLAVAFELLEYGRVDRVTHHFEYGDGLDRDLGSHPRIVYQKQETPGLCQSICLAACLPSCILILVLIIPWNRGPYAHFLNLQAGNVHTADYIGKEGDHLVVAHGHVGNDLLESDLLLVEVLILLAAAVELEA